MRRERTNATGPVLVTGSHRSGSTWAGLMLAAAPGTALIHEPFNVGVALGVVPKPFENWFQYVCDDNAGRYATAIDRVLRYRYPLAANLAKAKTAADMVKIIGDQSVFLLHRAKGDRPIVKDALALFSAEWLSRTFGMNVLVMIRHPAAFCSSLKLKNWRFDFDNFLKQPLLMSRYLGRFEKEIREYAQHEKDLLDQSILLWNCIHDTISNYRGGHPEWLFVRHEDLSRDPLAGFRRIYDAFDLAFTERVESTIRRASGSHNPAEQQARNEFVRDSVKNIDNWKSRLTADEIARIREKTFEVSSLFYAEDEW